MTTSFTVSPRIIAAIDDVVRGEIECKPVISSSNDAALLQRLRDIKSRWEKKGSNTSKCNDGVDDDGDSCSSQMKVLMTLDAIEDLAVLHRKMTDYRKMGKANGVGSYVYVHTLLQDSIVTNCNVGVDDDERNPPATRKKKKDPKFQAYLDALRARQERRALNRLVVESSSSSSLTGGGGWFGSGNKKGAIPLQSLLDDGAGVPGGRAMSSSDSFSTTNDGGESVAAMVQDIGFGVNVIVLMFTGFCVFWYLGRQMYGDENKIMPAVMGLGGLIGAMLLETVLFVVRQEKQHIREKLQRRGKLNHTFSGKGDE